MPRKSDGKREPEHCGVPAVAPGDATKGSGLQRRLKRHCKEMEAGLLQGGPTSRQEPELSCRQHTRQADVCSPLSCCSWDMGRSQEQMTGLEMGSKDKQSI